MSATPSRFLRALAFLPVLLACGGGEKHSGVVSETTNGLAGTVRDGGGKGVAAARVAYRPASFLPGEGPASRRDTGTLLTDAEGRYRVEGLPAGEYLLDIRSGDGLAAAVRHAVEGGGVDTLPAATVAAPGRIVLRFAAGPSGDLLVRVFGTAVSLQVAAGDTAVIDGLGEEDYRLRVSQAGKDLTMDSVPVASGSLTSVAGVDPASGTFQVTPPSRFALDSALVHDFLAGSGALKATTFGAAVRLRGDRIVGVNLAGVALDSLPAAVGRLTFLDTLWLNACKLVSLPDTLFSLGSLKSLNLSYNNALPLPKRLYSMPSLVHLDISGLALSAVDPDIAGLAGLKELRLSNNPMGAFPMVLASMPSLEILAITDMQLDSVPATILADTRYKQLFLSGNRLASLPDAFTAGHALEKLLLDRNQLTALPPSIRQLGKLQVLHLGQNSLCTVPGETRTFIDSVPQKDAWTASQTGC